MGNWKPMADECAVVILAAGQGTRMKSRLPKVLHRAGGKPLLLHAIEAALGVAAPERVYVVTGYEGEMVGAEAAKAGVQSVFQAEQLGTGHAVMCARERLADFEGRLLVTVGDCPLIRAATLAALAEKQRVDGAAAVVATTEVSDATGYGRIIRDSAGAVQAIVEQRVCTPEQLAVREINSGIFCFDARSFRKYVDEIGTDNPAREYYLTDIVAILIRAGLRVSALKLADPAELLGINNRVELAAADRILRERKVRQLMLDGVTIEKPETVTIDADVKIGIDSAIGPFAQITGNSVLGENCRIGACSLIESSILGDQADVGPFSVISDSRLEAGAHAGPFARIRMGAHLQPGAYVGNFVELKKTRMGAGAKSAHLAYLGDATIGEKTNIGAGTITCNYDGRNKHETHIGADTFIGSNSTLVAPVDIERGAYVAAGSVITDPVPEDTLALGRARQVNKPEWKKKRLSKN
jgi:bifunctional UDP-N-acetylglucosamine pyrophosphorylase / glucosamine-1-phosphate N-acetyltransferase